MKISLSRALKHSCFGRHLVTLFGDHIDNENIVYFIYYGINYNQTLLMGEE